MQPDLRFMDRLTKKPSKRNRDLIKYTVFAVLSSKHPTSLQIFSKTPSEYIFFGGGFSFFFFLLVLWQSATVLSLLPGLIRSMEKGQLWRQGCCDVEDDCFVGAGTQIKNGSVNKPQRMCRHLGKDEK